MILIAGLGNPGEKYENTPHNIGFMVLDNFLKKATSVEDSTWEESKRFNSFIAKVGNDLILVKPGSFMNASGAVVGKLIRFYKIPSFGLYVVHDDLDLPLGKMKISFGHGAAGHKGVESIIENLGSNNFVRIRVGIGGNKKIDTPERFVLAEFEDRDSARVRKAVKKSTEAIEFILKDGVERAANRFN